MSIICRLFSIKFGLLQESLRFGQRLLRARVALVAENLFLRKQSAFYQERAFRPGRNGSTGGMLLWLLSRSTRPQPAAANVVYSDLISPLVRHNFVRGNRIVLGIRRLCAIPPCSALLALVWRPPLVAFAPHRNFCGSERYVRTVGFADACSGRKLAIAAKDLENGNHIGKAQSSEAKVRSQDAKACLRL